MNIVLLDSLQKRIRFLDTVIEELCLDHVETLHGRAEDYAKKKEYRERFDLCVSRAVANLATLSEYCVPYIRVGGSFVSYKSGNVEEEIKESKKAVELLGGEVKNIVKFQLPGTEIRTVHLYRSEKRKVTKKKYPRKQEFLQRNRLEKNLLKKIT